MRKRKAPHWRILIPQSSVRCSTENMQKPLQEHKGDPSWALNPPTDGDSTRAVMCAYWVEQSIRNQLWAILWIITTYTCCARTLNIVKEFSLCLCLYSSVNGPIMKKAPIVKNPLSACTRMRFCHCRAAVAETFTARHRGRDPRGQNIPPRRCWNLEEMRAAIFLARCYQVNLSPAGLTASICPTCDKLEMKSVWQL